MKIIAFDPDENMVIVKTDDGQGFIADLELKLRYKPKMLASLVMDDSWTTKDFPDNLPTLDQIMNYKQV